MAGEGTGLGVGVAWPFGSRGFFLFLALSQILDIEAQ